MQKLNFSLTEDQTNLILNALSDGPYKLVADLITEIRTQAIPQLVKENKIEEVQSNQKNGAKVQSNGKSNGPAKHVSTGHGKTAKEKEKSKVSDTTIQ